jgi:hypothetical protein
LVNSDEGTLWLYNNDIRVIPSDDLPAGTARLACRHAHWTQAIQSHGHGLGSGLSADPINTSKEQCVGEAILVKHSGQEADCPLLAND